MKRAGIVGVRLAHAVLAKLKPARPSRLHLAGHRVGGRLVTAAAHRWKPVGALELSSLTILQGACSHNALARAVALGLASAFPSVVGKRPIVITHAHNDLACTIGCALASRLWRAFGAMGAGPGVSEGHVGRQRIRRA